MKSLFFRETISKEDHSKSQHKEEDKFCDGSSQQEKGSTGRRNQYVLINLILQLDTSTEYYGYLYSDSSIMLCYPPLKTRYSNNAWLFAIFKMSGFLLEH